MSRMHREIQAAMTDLRALDGEGLSARFRFPKEFIGFQGHFENEPVLPGVCKIQAVLAMYEMFHHKTFRLREVSQAKYFMPVTHDEQIQIQCRSKLNEDGSLGVKAAVQRENEKVAALQLVLENSGS